MYNLILNLKEKLTLRLLSLSFVVVLVEKRGEIHIYNYKQTQETQSKAVRGLL